MNGINKPLARKVMSGMFGSATEREEEEKKKKEASQFQRIKNMLAGKKE